MQMAFYCVIVLMFIDKKINNLHCSGLGEISSTYNYSHAWHIDAESPSHYQIEFVC